MLNILQARLQQYVNRELPDGVKLNIQKTIHKKKKKNSTFMASSPITSWHIDEGKLETVADVIFLDPKITMDLDCSHKIKTHLLLGELPLWLR